jgi:hypothetical protein
MHRCLSGLLLLMLLPMCAIAQRHGRADSVQNYTKSMRPSNPELAVNFSTTHKWVYFHLTEVRKRNRTTVSTTDPATHVTNTYEGVSLNELVPNGLTGYRFEVFKGAWAFRDKRVLSSDDLNMESEVLVADTINGKKLAGDSPFNFVAKTKRGDAAVVTKLAYIKFAETP